jgi:hypothetical protein
VLEDRSTAERGSRRRELSAPGRALTSTRAVTACLLAWSSTAGADEPPATKNDPAIATPTPTPPPSMPSPPAVEEVRVSGKRDQRTPTEHRLTRDEIRLIPGAFGDPFRAIDISPGLVPTVSGVPYFYIRGAPPSAVGYFVDEVRVPYLFHFALGPGVIQPALIEEVALHPAAFPARYGRFAGGVVAGRTREPGTELHSEGQVRLFDAGAYAEAPLANGRASVGVGGRYSYTGALVSLVAPDLTIDYRDYNARASYKIDDRWRASALALGAYDYASQIEQRVEKVYFASEFHRLDLRLDRRGADGATSRIAATVGIDRSRIEGVRFAQDVLVDVRGRHRWSVRRDVEVELGADLQTDFYSGDLPSRFALPKEDYARVEAFFAPRTETATGAWSSVSFRPGPGWDFTGTLRSDVFTSDGKVAVGPSPRLSTRIPITGALAFLGALGVAPQPPAFALPVPAIGYRGLPGGLAYAFQKSAGLEVKLPFLFTLRTVGFHHSYVGQRDISRQDGGPDDPVRPPVSLAQAFGAEVSLSRRLSQHFSAFSSTTISRSQVGSTSLYPARASEWDRTYVVQIGGAVDLGRGWRISSRFLTYGGWPDYPDPENEGLRRNAAVPTRPGGRLPGFARLDARVEKRWSFEKDRWLALVFEGLNVTGSKEVIGRDCFAQGQRGPTDPGGCADETFGPVIVPSIGVEGGL